jgi:acetyl esterase/lipase
VWAILFPAFVTGLAVSEGAGWALAMLAGAVVALVSQGALHDWPGWVGLVCSLAAAGGLVHELRLAARAPELFDEALGQIDGGPPSIHTRAWRDIVAPLWLADRHVRRIANVRYAPGAGRRHLLDVYAPKEGTSDAPVLLQIHGGAWMFGSKRTQGRPLMNRLARDGWVCVAVNYRLSPRVRYPEHLVDCKRALAWIREHVADYGGDPARVAVTGGSAGGHLAALLALSANEPELQPGFEHVDTSVLASVPMYGAYSLAELFTFTGAGRRVGAWMGRLVTGADLVAERARFERASPMYAVREGAPPFLVVHGTADNLVPVEQVRRFVLSLREHCPDTVVYVELPGAPHAFDVFHSVRSDAAAVAVERFLSWVLSGAGSPAARTASDARATSGPTTMAHTAPS